MSTFASLGLAPAQIDRLDAMGIHEPTEVQAAVLAVTGGDLVASAPTGSGKTIAFALPLVEAVSAAEGRGPHGLVLVPTRELALQVMRVVASLAPRKVHVAALYGGTPYRPQLERLGRGVDLVVATPGRLLDLLARRALSLAEVRYAVVDEVDRMADLGFADDLEDLLGRLPEHRRIALFSATMDGAVERLAKRFLSDPAVVEVHADRPELEHRFVRIRHHEKARAVAEFADDFESMIVFCNTRHQVDQLTDTLGRLAVGVHGGLGQRAREAAIRRFDRGTAPVLVATDVAARGLDIAGVDAVLHYDLPSSFTDYLHRSGRTGRAGRRGVVVALVGERDGAKAGHLERQLGLPRARYREGGRPSRGR